MTTWRSTASRCCDSQDSDGLCRVNCHQGCVHRWCMPTFTQACGLEEAGGGKKTDIRTYQADVLLKYSRILVDSRKRQQRLHAAALRPRKLLV